jgi:sugar/nucleoside kinase (ribokinase family)
MPDYPSLALGAALGFGIAVLVLGVKRTQSSGRKGLEQSTDLPVISVLGDAWVDMVASGLEGLPSWGTDTLCDCIVMQAGGSGLNTAVQMAGLLDSLPLSSHRVRLHTSWGRDLFQKIVSEKLEKAKVLVSSAVIPGKNTGSCFVLSSAEDRGFVTDVGSSQVVRIQHLDKELILHSDHIHIAGFYNQKAFQQDVPKLFIEARKRGVTTSIDTAYDATEHWGGMQDVYAHLDLLMPNEVEVVKLAASAGAKVTQNADAKKSSTSGPTEEELHESMRFFVTKKQVRLVVVTNGAKGAWAAFQNQAEGGEVVMLHCPASDLLAPAVDPTGAGDAFKAGFISEWKRLQRSSRAQGAADAVETMQQVDRVNAALAVGCAAGAFAVSQLGACPVQASRKHIAPFLR